MRSTVAAFGFVYIHPLADGNGRVHRFLVNDSLRRVGAVREPMILPVSSLIDRDATQRRAYERMLDVVFEGVEAARPAWRYLDLSAHVAYLADVVQRTIGEDMRAESRWLRSHAQARAAVKEIVECRTRNSTA
jgi:Fic family protein